MKLLLYLKNPTLHVRVRFRLSDLLAHLELHALHLTGGFPQRSLNTGLSVSCGNLGQSVRCSSEEGSCETGGRESENNL